MIKVREPLVVDDLDPLANKKALAQTSPKQAPMLSELLYAKYRQLLEAKCTWAGVELIRIDPVYTSTIGAVKYTLRRGWSVHATATGVVARRGQKLTERLPRPARLSVFRCGVTITPSRYLQGKAEIHVGLSGEKFMQRTEE